MFTNCNVLGAMEKEMATHSRVLAWRIPGMVEPGGLPSMGLHRIGHDWCDLAAAAAAAGAMEIHRCLQNSLCLQGEWILIKFS